MPKHRRQSPFLLKLWFFLKITGPHRSTKGVNLQSEQASDLFSFPSLLQNFSCEKWAKAHRAKNINLVPRGLFSRSSVQVCIAIKFLRLTKERMTIVPPAASHFSFFFCKSACRADKNSRSVKILESGSNAGRPRESVTLNSLTDAPESMA